MRTTIKQQMAAIKRAMSQPALEVSTTKRVSELDQWLALNDAYSSLASIALMESIKKPTALS